MKISIVYSQPVFAIERFDRETFIFYVSYPPPDIELKILEWVRSNSDIASCEFLGELPSYLNIEINMRHAFATWSAIEDLKNLLIMNDIKILQ